MRAELLERYRALPLPSTRDEHWRFTDLTGFDPDAWTAEAGAAAAVESLVELDVAALRDDRRVGHPHRRGAGGNPLRAADRRASARRLARPARRQAPRAQRRGLAARRARPRPCRRRAREAALRPRRERRPGRLALLARARRRRAGRALYVVQELTSAEPELEAYLNGVVEVVVRDGAKAEIVNLQRLSSKAWLFASCHARVERDAELDWVEGGFGSSRGKVWIQNDLADRGATSRVTGAYFADGSQHLDYDTYQLHAAPDTTSDFAFKGALRDSAATVWRGMIRVEEGAQKTNAYQENRNLLLSKTATANSIPGLEILANDVRCTHGATLSQVDREQLFYLMARGLPRPVAERLIVRGFFQDVLDRIELQPVRDAVGAALEARIPES